MANLRDIRDRISSVKNTQQITRAMKMVAAARLRKAQERMTDARPYTYSLQKMVQKLVQKSDTDNPLLRKKSEPGHVLLLVMGSDRGLCGGFNTNLFRVVEKQLHENFQDHLEEKRLSMICFGKKAYDYFRVRKYPVIDHKVGFFDKLEFRNVSEVVDEIIFRFKDKEYDEVYLAYNEFKSVIAQRRKFVKVLPIERNDQMEAMEPQQDDGDEILAEKNSLEDIDYLYEPDPETILNQVLPLSITIRLWQAALESFAAEQGARMTAMDSATENAGEIISDLELEYNQARQAAITTEISEIVSGAEALSE
ncbi:ATP synthase F1 subunit gamma [Balneolales bacterium ANBcel1]|nr:ATP synthase F1 subunit gamma [Balneolales bacterium ANBcel1]